MPGDNKSLEIKNLSNLLPIDWDKLNHVNSLKAGWKLHQTSTRAKSFFNDSYSLWIETFPPNLPRALS